MSPAYIILSLGLDYRPVQGMTFFVSPFTERWIFIANNDIAAKGLYGVDSGQNITSQTGAYATFNINKRFGKNLLIRSRTDLYSNYKHDPQNIDLYMTNMFQYRINKNFTINYSLDFIYDDDVRLFGPNESSPGLQIKSIIGFGFNIPLDLKD
jgi:hypothetical protein